MTTAATATATAATATAAYAEFLAAKALLATATGLQVDPARSTRPSNPTSATP